MLLALWFDFPPASWIPGVTPPPQLPDGGAKGAGHGKKDVDDYAQYPAIPDRADESYWREREIFMRRHLPIRPSAAVQNNPEGQKLVRQHNRIVALAPRLPSKENLLRMSKKLDDLTLQINRIESDSDEEDILALLLS